MNDDEQMLDDCEERESRLTEWESDFVASLRDQQSYRASFSYAQSQKLEEIWERVTRQG